VDHRFAGPAPGSSGYYIDLESGQEGNQWGGTEAGRSLARRGDQCLVKVLLRVSGNSRRSAYKTLADRGTT
jgi:hypothetical protein